jgi:hypothetical protein
MSMAAADALGVARERLAVLRAVAAAAAGGGDAELRERTAALERDGAVMLEAVELRVRGRPRRRRGRGRAGARDEARAARWRARGVRSRGRAGPPRRAAPPRRTR